MSAQPLDGLKVVEIAGIGPVPFACSQLEDMGATVIRIERPNAHSLPHNIAGVGHRARPSISLDLKDEDDRSIAKTLIARADVLVEPYRPGVAERLGIGPDDVCAENPRLVYTRMTGWGQDGPYAQMAGHDINYIGLSGSLAATGPADTPIPPLNLVGDFGGGAMFAVTGILAALVERASTGMGQVIDVAMVDGAAALLGPIRDLLDAGLWSESRGQNLLDGGAPFYACYRTSDDEFMAVGALEPQFYSLLVSGLGLDEADLGNRMDPGEWDRIRTTFAAAFSTCTRDEWTEVFDGTDACVTPVLTMREVPHHPHNVARHALVGESGAQRPHPAPRFGEPHGLTKGYQHDKTSVSRVLTDFGVASVLVEDVIEGGGVTWT